MSSSTAHPAPRPSYWIAAMLVAMTAALFIEPSGATADDRTSVSDRLAPNSIRKPTPNAYPGSRLRAPPATLQRSRPPYGPVTKFRIERQTPGTSPGSRVTPRLQPRRVPRADALQGGRSTLGGRTGVSGRTGSGVRPGYSGRPGYGVRPGYSGRSSYGGGSRGGYSGGRR